ncbi:group XIIB secretory phospholipase A2-like protein [Mugil cephalus]|uniref:group XIIB secretory phospholipase A2-like protein n=1 Tax=Mugil cephalus TaxID=48193 RepID=UPI001FB641DE|nr:group XIIB secretory phospholipase A2-like protein [Mugil cephalus]
MLLRTVVLLVLCVSSGMCATLGFYQEKEEEAAVDSTAASAVAGDSVDAANEGVAAAEIQVEDRLLSKILGVNNQEGDGPEGDVHVADDAKKPEHGPAGESPALTKDAVAQNQPSSEEEANEIKPAQKNESLNRALAQEDESSWSLNSIRSSFQTVHGYFDSLVELVGGPDGVCQYRCRYGKLPEPRPGYRHPEPNGCSSSLLGLQLDMGIPAMTQCCSNLDVCYDTCGTSKYDCDAKFRLCLHDICSDLKKSLGFVSRVQACESMADALYNTVWTLGCRPYMNSQRAACICEGEERDEL